MQLVKMTLLTRPELVTYALFAASSAVAVALVTARMIMTGNLNCLYLPWNLFLAWIPLGLAFATRWLTLNRSRRKWLIAGTGAGWLLFFPNAPYILTDLMHLAQTRPGPTAPLWFDLLLHLLVAITALYLGFASLALIQGMVSRAFGKVVGWEFALVSLALSGFGVYIGRFLRWNSWDVICAPVPLFTDISQRLLHPTSHPRTYGFSMLCFLLLVLTYLMCFSLPRLQIVEDTSPSPSR